MIEHIYRFPTEGKPVSCVQIKSGHINRTYLIETDAGVKYILQWVNPYVFPNIDAIMDNMTALREHLEKNPRGDVPMISYIDTHEGKSYYRDSDGGCWRIYKFVPNSICLQYSQDIEDFYESAKAFGSFLNAFCDFPAEKLQESIVNFHHTPDRYRQLREALSEDCCGRASQVQRELDYIFSREDEGCLLHRMRENGRDISRQTIAGYTRKLVRHNLIMPDTANYIYYFAYKDTQRFVEKEEYLAAWHEYWRNKEKGFASWEAICMMRHKYKGVARKQAIPEINCIYNRKIDYMLSAIQTEMEYELDTGFKL